MASAARTTPSAKAGEATPAPNAARSMTGYGRAVVEKDSKKVTAEIRAVNGRFLKLSVKVLGRYGALEDRVKQLLSELGIKRGSVDVNLFFETGTTEEGRYGINAAVTAHYVKQARAIAKKLKLKGDVPIAALLTLPGVVAREDSPDDLEDMWVLARKALEAAIRDFNGMRAREGAAMVADVRTQLKALGEHRVFIEKTAPDAQMATLQRFRERVAKMLDKTGVQVELDKGFLEREMVLASDRMDTSEEMARLNSHFQQMEETMTGGGEIGKKLDFLTQELFRETNTIGSKANDERITHRVVEMKNAIERIREQVQNLE